MSNIGVQGTRNQGKAEVTTGRDRFEEQESRLSHLPFYAGAAISALVLYLKSSLSPDSKAFAATTDEAKHSPIPDQGPLDNNPHVPTDAELAKMCFIEKGFEDEAQVLDKMAKLMGRHPAVYAVPQSAWLSRDYAGDSLDRNVRPVQKIGATDGEVPFNFPAISSNDNNMSAGGTADELPDGSTGGPGGGGPGGGPGDKPEAPTDPQPKKNHAPTISGRVRLGTQFVCTNIAIMAAALLGNASDADADVLTVQDVRINGQLLSQVNGAYTYHGEDLGPVLISYVVSDGKLTATATAEIIFVERPPIVGTDNDDILLGTACDDQIIGNDGNDRIDGNAGDDTIFGGRGDDHLVGGDGDDVIYGGLGNDVIVGGMGDDVLSGDEGDDRVFGGQGNDILRGGSGADVLSGDEGNDVLVGEEGNDTLDDGTGQDHVDGGSGDDSVMAASDGADDIFAGGTGYDKISYKLATKDIVFDVDQNTIEGADIGHDQAAQFESFEGGGGDDTFVAAIGVHAIDSAQDDVEQNEHERESSSAGNTYLGADGVDTLSYHHAANAITFEIAAGKATGIDIGTDTFADIESFTGGAGDDTFVIGAGTVTVDGKAGHDVFKFETNEDHETSAVAFAHIKSLEVGDVIKMAHFDIFEDAFGEQTDDFENYYLNQVHVENSELDPDTATPFQIRFETYGEKHFMYLDADFDHNGHYEMTAEFDGNHYLTFTNTQHA